MPILPAQEPLNLSMPQSITELVVDRHNPASVELLLPMLAHLSRTSENRWITWVTTAHTQGCPSRQLLKDYGIDSQRLRIIHADNATHQRWITWEVMMAGNSQAVIASLGVLSRHDRAYFNRAAERGQCQALLWRLH